MTSSISRIEQPELFFGFVSPIGADVKGALRSFGNYLNGQGYRVVEIKVTDIFTSLAKYHAPDKPLVRTPQYDRYKSHIAYGNQIRRNFGDEVLASTSIIRIIRKRLKLGLPDPERFTKTAFLIHQFKRKEEIDLFRAVYGRLFFQISVYSRRGARVDAISRAFASSRNSALPHHYRSQAEAIVQIDENEIDELHGQRVAKIFHDADFLINLDIAKSVQDQVHRFCDLVFSSNSISPTKMEYGMFLAKAAALRTLDLSRQVGAAIFTPQGEVVSLGSNEVPKATGGTYWPDEEHDDREFRRAHDSNDGRKREILSEILTLLGAEKSLEDVLKRADVRDSQFMDALEYGRIVHAEMSAICDAARLGRSVKGSVLYCTTFPCHMCAKHIVASGLCEVVFLEPYPKSLASELHSDSIEIEGADRGRYQSFPSARFSHFYGVTPRRYRELFERGKRKDDDGGFVHHGTGIARPFMEVKFPFYIQHETQILREASGSLAAAAEAD
ncbi:MAG: anti-phage dCTP deaminase [Beijerinckiaceae bacterium]|nr:anti-phage dCTP deaminase [Beijerinckiaceae bacterium]